MINTKLQILLCPGVEVRKNEGEDAGRRLLVMFSLDLAVSCWDNNP